MISHILITCHRYCREKIDVYQINERICYPFTDPFLKVLRLRWRCCKWLWAAKLYERSFRRWGRKRRRIRKREFEPLYLSICALSSCNNNNRNNIWHLDYHSYYNTRSKDTFEIIKSSSNWGLLISVNSALPDWNALPMDIKSYQLNLLECHY